MPVEDPTATGGGIENGNCILPISVEILLRSGVYTCMALRGN